MQKIRIGVWLSKEHNPHAGGGYGYYDQILKTLSKLNGNNYEIKYLKEFDKKIKKVEPEVLYFQLPNLNKNSDKFFFKILNKLFRIFFSRNLILSSDELKQNFKIKLSQFIDVIYYPTPNCLIDYFPFILTIWDLGHINSYPFPELSMNGIFEKRDDYYSKKISKALFIVCESKVGKEELLKYYPIYEKKIKIVSLLPSEIINDDIAEIKPMFFENNNIDFIHYPAQFWAHKNHFNLIIAFKEVLKKKPTLKLILTGSDKGNLEYILCLINELDLNKNVIYLGFVSVQELKWIFINSKGLVMPTLLGPTNMPIIEAAILKCKVACSFLPGHIEQLGKYGFYFDPENTNEIASKILDMLDNSVNYDNFYYSKDNSRLQLNDLFNHLISIRYCWGKSDRFF